MQQNTNYALRKRRQPFGKPKSLFPFDPGAKQTQTLDRGHFILWWIFAVPSYFSKAAASSASGSYSEVTSTASISTDGFSSVKLTVTTENCLKSVPLFKMYFPLIYSGNDEIAKNLQFLVSKSYEL